MASKIVKTRVYTCFTPRKTRKFFKTVEKIALVLDTPTHDIFWTRSNRNQTFATFSTISFFIYSTFMNNPSILFKIYFGLQRFSVIFLALLSYRVQIDVFLHISFAAHHSLLFSTVSKNLSFIIHGFYLPTETSLPFSLLSSVALSFRVLEINSRLFSPNRQKKIF